MFRFNNPDALLVLPAWSPPTACCGRSRPRAAVVVAGRWPAPRSGSGSWPRCCRRSWWLPAFALVFLVALTCRVRSRVLRLLGGAAALVVVGGLVSGCWSRCGRRSARPYIGGSQHNSILELALGYNGLGRLTGDETGGLGNMNHDVGWGRLFGAEMGGQIAWLLPAALIAVVAGLCHHPAGPAHRRHSGRAAAVGWLAGGHRGGVQLHERHLASRTTRWRWHLRSAAAVGIGATLLWRRRADIRAATTLSGIVRHHGGTGLRSAAAEFSSGCPGCGVAVLVVGIAGGPAADWSSGAWSASAAYGGGRCWRWPPRWPDPRPTRWPPRHPARGAIPSAGPRLGLRRTAGRTPRRQPARRRADRAAAARTPTDYTWVAAAVGSNNAAGYQLATGAPVMAVGGFNGTDPAPTLAQFQADVADRRSTTSSAAR